MILHSDLVRFLEALPVMAADVAEETPTRRRGRPRKLKTQYWPPGMFDLNSAMSWTGVAEAA